MPLMIYLKNPTFQIILEGELKPGDWLPLNPLRRLLPRRIVAKNKDGRAIVFSERRVVMVREITEEEIEEAKVRGEAMAAAAGGPLLRIPGGGRRH